MFDRGTLDGRDTCYGMAGKRLQHVIHLIYRPNDQPGKEWVIPDDLVH